MKEKINIIITELFHISLVTYVLFLLAELIREESVSFFFNLNILLAIVVVSGILSTIFTREVEEKKRKTSKELDRFMILILSVGGGLVILEKTYTVGWISLVISLGAAVIIALLSNLILHQTSENDL